MRKWPGTQSFAGSCTCLLTAGLLAQGPLNVDSKAHEFKTKVAGVAVSCKISSELMNHDVRRKPQKFAYAANPSTGKWWKEAT